MIVGMGVVFTFLVLLVAFMSLSGAFFTRFSHLFPESKPSAAAPKPADSSEKLAVALATAYRKQRGS